MLTGVLFRAQVEQLLPRLLDLGARAALLLCAALALYVTYKWYQRVRFFALLRSARISAEELYRMMDAGEGPLVLDVRSPTAVLLDPRGIPGARHVPLHDLGGHVQDLPRDREIVAYCTCPNEASAAQVAKLLMNQGFRRVRPLQGGLDAWVAAGHQVELLRRSP
ncbi:MAG: thiosulfate sulfurtransferase GlpE [Sinobacteraceae bacterium]|nr:thiosulfate sulfurtransferase GlpE [Nevskiaceae bacterium]